MPASKKPRKKYNPDKKFLRFVSHTNEDAGRRPLSTDTQMHVMMANHDAMLRLTRGQGGTTEWEIVASALHMGSVLDELSYGGQFAETFNTAIRAHAECGARYTLKGVAGYAGPELAAVNLALQVHDEQVRQATRRDMEQALNTCCREGDQGGSPRSPITYLVEKIEAHRASALTC